MQEQYLLAQWFAKAFNVDLDTAYRHTHFDPCWLVSLALIESRLYEDIGGRKPETRHYIPGYSDFETVGLTWQEARTVSDLLLNIFPTLVKSVKGDRDSRLQVEAMKKIINFRAYKIDLSDVRKFAEAKGADASRARAFAIRRWMGSISTFVTPRWADATSVSDGTVKLLSPGAALGPPELLSKVQQVIKKNSTLESLAIELYRGELAERGFRLSTRQLRSDLEEFKDWRPQEGENAVPLDIKTLNNQGKFVKSETVLIGRSSDEWMYVLMNRRRAPGSALKGKKAQTRKQK